MMEIDTRSLTARKVAADGGGQRSMDGRNAPIISLTGSVLPFDNCAQRRIHSAIPRQRATAR
jgi:hypothetical protein